MLKIAAALLLFLFAVSCEMKKRTINSTEDLAKLLEIPADTVPPTSEDTLVVSVADDGSDTLIRVKGKRAFRDVDAEVNTHLISVRFWYARSFPKAKENERITVKFSIDEMGVPKEVSLVSTTLKDRVFVRRVVEDIPQWRFARFPEEGKETTYVTYPIILRPNPQN